MKNNMQQLQGCGYDVMTLENTLLVWMECIKLTNHEDTDENPVVSDGAVPGSYVIIFHPLMKR